MLSVHGFRCCDNTAPNAKCQRVLVLALCLVERIGASVYLADDCVHFNRVANRGHRRSADTRKLLLRRTETIARDSHCPGRRLELSVHSPPSSVADCGNVCQTLKVIRLLIFMPGAGHPRSYYFTSFKFTFIIIITISKRSS